MTQVNTANISQVKGLLTQFGAITGESGSFYLNSVWGAYDNVNTLADGESSSDQQASALQSLMSNILSVIEKFFGQNKAGTAASEKAAHTQAANDIQRKQQEELTKLQGEISTIYSEIDTNIATATQLVESLTALGENVTALQARLEEIKQQIEAEKANLENAETPEEKLEILQKIQGLSQEIINITTQLQVTEDQILALNEQIAETEDEIQTVQTNAQNVIDNSASRIETIAQDGAREVTSVAVKGAEGAEDTAIASAAQSVAATAGGASIVTLGATAEVAVEAEKTAVDYSGAAATEFSDLSLNLPKIMNGLGRLGENLALLNNFGLGANNQFDAFDGLVGTFNSIQNPILTAVGSTAIADNAIALQQSIETDIDNLENQEQNGDVQLATLGIDTENIKLEV